MSIVISNDWLLESLKRDLGISPTAEVEARLFTNNKTPSNADVLADYTEAAGGGYAAKILDDEGYTLTPGNPAKATRNVAWTFTGPLTGGVPVYGAYFTSGGVYVGARKFAAPQPISGPETPVTLNPFEYRRA